MLLARLCKSISATKVSLRAGQRDKYQKLLRPCHSHGTPRCWLCVFRILSVVHHWLVFWPLTCVSVTVNSKAALKAVSPFPRDPDRRAPRPPRRARPGRCVTVRGQNNLTSQNKRRVRFFSLIVLQCFTCTETAGHGCLCLGSNPNSRPLTITVMWHHPPVL